jgi:flagellar basal-body rod protein FlgB
MIDSLSTITSSAVATALDALSLRQQLIAANLANAGSAGYAARRMEFEAALQKVLAQGAADSPAETLQALNELRSDLNRGEYTRRAPAGAIELDLEMLRLNDTVIRYQALIQGLGKYGSLARMAVTGEVKG